MKIFVLSWLVLLCVARISASKGAPLHTPEYLSASQAEDLQFNYQIIQEARMDLARGFIPEGRLWYDRGWKLSLEQGETRVVTEAGGFFPERVSAALEELQQKQQWDTQTPGDAKWWRWIGFIPIVVIPATLLLTHKKDLPPASSPIVWKSGSYERQVLNDE